MVALGMVDGMVSGATHTTAETIRPAFELVKTRPDVSIVSSVFLMCLADRVLVYGDCAVNPHPTRRAAGRHRDLLGGDRGAVRDRAADRDAVLLDRARPGSGEEVEQRADGDASSCATRAPSLSVEGPIQYDAAVDASVARTKLPGSAVAGRATVFIFPDLNTGNNTYKAVQRSAGAIAIGPVLQGLEQAGQRPVARGDGARHRQHRRDHRDPVADVKRLRRQLRVVVAEVVGRRHRRPGATLGSGTVQRIEDHAAALESVLAVAPLDGRRRRSRTVSSTAASASRRRCSINDAVLAAIRDLAVLAPLHNPANADGIEVARRALPDVPHVAIFDTAFHATLPPRAFTYAVPRGVGRAPLRLPRHLARVRVARGGARPRARGRGRRRDRAAPRQRRQRDRRGGRAQRRHLDGPDAARRPRDGHALGRRRPRAGRCTCAARATCRRTRSTPS